MARQIAVIPGDGIGPEVVEAELEVLQATGIDFSFSTYDAGDDCLAKTGVALPEETLKGALAAEGVIFGAVGASAAEVILRLRSELGTYVNLRPAKAYPGVKCLWPETDIMVVRENTECLYVGQETEVEPGRIEAVRIITEKASLRISRYAFKYAHEHGVSKVTAAHKSNVLIKGDSLFLDCCRRAASGYPEIELEEALADSVCTRMVMEPAQFQVIVTTNLFGDLLSDLAAGLIGGLGMCPSANLGGEHALFEPVHGSAPDIVGTGKANPFAAIMCGSMLLEYLGEKQASESVAKACEKCLAAGRVTTDLGGDLSTMEMARAIIAEMG